LQVGGDGNCGKSDAHNSEAQNQTERRNQARRMLTCTHE
jgi:hypothetical protein